MDCDVVVIGLGSAGAAAARACARAGLRVHAVDASPPERAGAHWVNGVALWCFDEGGVSRPEGAERLAGSDVFHLVAGWGPHRLTLRSVGHAEVDMRLLVRRLHAEARAAGARLEGGRRVRGAEEDAEGVTVDTDAGPIRGRWLVDASGLRGAGLGPRSPVPAAAICVGAQEVRALADAAAARAYFVDHGVRPGEILCFTGVAGGFSIVNVSLELDLDEPRLSILTGSIPGNGHPSGVRLLEDFVRQHGWVGDRVFGGARPIPLAAPPAAMARGRIALLGDAARQVFAGHGSGIGMQLIAARVLAEALAGGGTPWDYNARFQRGWGGELAASAVFARYTATMPLQDFTDAMTSGLLPRSASEAALLQRPPHPRLRELPAMALGAIAHPGIVADMAPILNKMSRCRRLWRRYPARERDLAGWLRRRDRLLGDES